MRNKRDPEPGDGGGEQHTLQGLPDLDLAAFARVLADQERDQRFAIRLMVRRPLACGGAIGNEPIGRG